MALGATVYNFDIDLADSDRGVYETLALRVARHPSESDEYLVARVLAYCIEYTDGIAFSPGGLSDPNEPPIAVRDLTGRAPGVDRHRHAGRGAAAPGRQAGLQGRRLRAQGSRSSGCERSPANGSTAPRPSKSTRIDRALIAAIVARLERRMAFSLSINDRELYLAFNDTTLTGDVKGVTWG